MTRTSPSTRAALLAAALAFATAAAADALPYPPAPRQPVTEVFHGTSVTDDYRWLEDTGAPAVRTWIAQQNALTRSVLDASLAEPDPRVGNFQSVRSTLQSFPLPPSRVAVRST